MEKWTTTKIGNYEITHKVGANPQLLLTAHLSDPIQIIGDHPVVHEKKLGREHFAFRAMDKFAAKNYHAPEILFNDLRAFDKMKLKEFEEPVALIKDSKKPYIHTVVTKWKKGSVNLDTYLRDKKIPLQRKIKMCKTAMTALARFDKTGYFHSHISAENFVVLPKDKAHLIDYSLILPKSAEMQERESVMAAVSLSGVLFAIHSNFTGTSEITYKLLDHYNRMINTPKRIPKEVK